MTNLNIKPFTGIYLELSGSSESLKKKSFYSPDYPQFIIRFCKNQANLFCLE